MKRKRIFLDTIFIEGKRRVCWEKAQVTMVVGFEISQLMELQERNKIVHDNPQTKRWEGSKDERLETKLIVPPSQEDTCLEFKGNSEKEEVVHEGVLSIGLHEDVFQNNKIVDTIDIISNVYFVPNVYQNKVNFF